MNDVIFIYNGHEDAAEVQFEPNGDFPVPVEGTTITRHGKHWQVASTSAEAVAPAGGWPVLRIDLTD